MKSELMDISMLREKKYLSDSETIEFLSKYYNLNNTALSIEIVRSCNLNCPGCWARISHDLSTSNSIEVMKTDILETTLKFGRNMGITKLTLLGGEPTLHPNITAIIKRAFSMGYRVSITTNGVFPTSKLEDLVSSNLSNISFSIDGSSHETHSKIRPSPNGNDTFSITIKNLEKAVVYSKKFGFTVTVNCTVFPINFHDAEATFRFVSNLGVKRIRVHFTFPGDTKRMLKNVDMQISDDNTCILPEVWLTLYNRCRILSKQFGVEIQIARVYGTSEVVKAKVMNPPCLHVQSDGKLLMCSTHSRLSDKGRHAYATIVDENRIELNHDCVLFDSSSKGTCCKAIPELIKSLPKDIQGMITEADGMGCIYLLNPSV